MSLEDRLREVLAMLHRQEHELGVIWRLFQNEPPIPSLDGEWRTRSRSP